MGTHRHRHVVAAFAFGLPVALAAAEITELSLPRAVGTALVANRNLVMSKLNVEGETYGLRAANADFDLKIVPTTVLGSINSNVLVPGTSGSNNSIGAQVTKKLELGTTVGLGPSWNRSGGVSNTTLNLSVAQPLFKGFGPEVNLDGVRRAQFSVASAGRNLEQARVNVALETIGAYYEAIKQQQLTALNDELAERLRRDTLIARSKERVGLASPMDTYRAQIRLKDAEDAANQARNSFQAVKNQLKLFLDMSLESEIALTPPLPAELGIAHVEIEAVQRRAELVQLRAEIEEAERAVKVAANALLPDVSVKLNYGQALISEPMLAQVLPTTQRQTTIFLQASSDVARTAEKANYQRAKLRVESLRVSLEAKSADIRRQVRQQLALLEEAKQRIALRGEQIRQAEGKLALAEVKFAHDMADNFAVIEAESELLRARSNRFATEADYAVGIYNLKAIAGHLLDSFPDK